MQHVVWLETANQDLDKILGYIEDRNLLAALNLHESIEYAVSQLPFHPYLYRLGRGSRYTRVSRSSKLLGDIPR